VFFIACAFPDGDELDWIPRHFRKCLGVKARIVWVGDRPEVACTGSDAKVLLAAGPRVFRCPDCTPASVSEEFLTCCDLLWHYLHLALSYLMSRDVQFCRENTHNFLRHVLSYATIFVECFGDKAVTPSLRELLDNAIFFMLVIAHLFCIELLRFLCL